LTDPFYLDPTTDSACPPRDISPKIAQVQSKSNVPSTEREGHGSPSMEIPSFQSKFLSLLIELCLFVTWVLLALYCVLTSICEWLQSLLEHILLGIKLTIFLGVLSWMLQYLRGDGLGVMASLRPGLDKWCPKYISFKRAG
jgi:hypothetical protein